MESNFKNNNRLIPNSNSILDNKNKICVFCSIIKNKTKLIYEDEIMVIFEDKKPDASVHLQAVPRQHIISINYLTKDHLDLIKNMKEKAINYLKDKYDIKELNMGFHKPPAVSIKHLHMHCIVPPYRLRKIKYFTNALYFRTVDEQINILTN
jgi:hypothetical protein